jgi:cysteinylglycine-S-conjugate dipeptidase
MIGTGGQVRAWSGPSSPSVGSTCRRWTARSTVSRYARAVLNVRVHPEQDTVEAQDVVIRQLREQRPFGIELDVRPGPTGNGFAAATGRPAYDAARAERCC